MCTADVLNDECILVQRLIEGGEDAFCELYAAYKNRLIFFAMRFLKSREYAEDIFQDAFTVIWQGRRFINPDASFSSYLIYYCAQSHSESVARFGESDQAKGTDIGAGGGL